MFAQTMKLHINNLFGSSSYNRAKKTWTFSVPKYNVILSFTKEEIENITEDQFLQKLSDLGVDISNTIRLENNNRKSPPTKYTNKGRGRPRKNNRVVCNTKPTNENIDNEKIPEDCIIIS